MPIAPAIRKVGPGYHTKKIMEKMTPTIDALMRKCIDDALYRVIAKSWYHVQKTIPEQVI